MPFKFDKIIDIKLLPEDLLMKRKSALPELLAPAGDMQCLYAAVAGGADAIYVGGRFFGARAYAKNFDMDELSRAVVYCHLHGVKLYVTVNTLIYDKEMRELSDFAAELWRIGVDAVIVCDLGAIREIKRRVPALPIHASTQMSVHNTYGADAAARLGCERVVVARELSFENIVKITENCSIETEVFLHGALCVCHSGQCLMSSLVGGRSGNRGECAQPCRLPYNRGAHVLSLSDLSLANHINKLIDSGVASLKIEGRMKSPDYVYTVTAIYRRLLDERRCADKGEWEKLRRVFSRGEFTDGYFKGDKFVSMTGVRSDDDKQLTRGVSGASFEPMRVSVRARLKIRLGEPSEMTIIGLGKEITVLGQPAERAKSSPLKENDVMTRLCKMGATFLSLSPEDIELDIDDGVNLPPSAINALRRDAAAAFECCERTDGVREYFEESFTRDSINSTKTAQIFSKKTVAEFERADVADSFDIVFLPIEHFRDWADGIAIPAVVTDSEIDSVRSLLREARGRGAKYALVGNIGHIELARSAGLIPVGDFRLNITNRCAAQQIFEMGIESRILSPELTLPMARDIGGAEIVYGRIPLMITERCFIKESFGCDKCSDAALIDRTGAKFPLMYEYGHRNLLFNSRPTYMGDRRRELEQARINKVHFIFTTESSVEIRKVIDAYKRGAVLSGEVRRIGKR